MLFGWDRLFVRFGGDATGITAAPFATAVTGGTLPFVLTAFVLTATPTSSDVELGLSVRIPVGQWTTIEHMPTHSSTCLGFLPGDVNGNRTANAVDGFALRAALSNLHATTPALHQADINHSGEATAEDLVMWLNVMNGAGALDPWLGATLPASCAAVSPAPRPASEVPVSGTR